MKAKVLLIVVTAVLALGILAAVSTQSVIAPVPPPTPPDRIGIGWTVVDKITGEAREFDGDWEGDMPWKLTQMVVHKKMVADGPGRWKPVRDNIEVICVDVQAHTISGVEMEPHIWKKVQEVLAAQ